MRLKDQCAIVTGGGGGLGEGIALCLAREGAHVVVSDNQMDPAEKVLAKVQALGRKSMAIQTDVTDEVQVKQLVDQTVKDLGALDIMVCCAGISGMFDRGLDAAEAMLIENCQPRPENVIFFPV